MPERQCCSERDLANVLRSCRGDRSTLVRLVDRLLRRRWSGKPAERGVARITPSKPDRALKPEHERLAAGRISKRLSIWRVKKLISQRKPPAQLGRGICDGPGPSAARQSSCNFSEGRVLPQPKQRDSGAFGDG